MHLFQESATLLVDREGVVRHLVHALNPAASMDWDGLLAALRALPTAHADGTLGRPGMDR